jgi:hypothetical protein
MTEPAGLPQCHSREGGNPGDLSDVRKGGLDSRLRGNDTAILAATVQIPEAAQ